MTPKCGGATAVSSTTSLPVAEPTLFEP